MQYRLLLVALFLVACAPSEQAVQTAIAETELARPTATPAPLPTSTPISGLFREKLLALIDEGSHLNALTSQGVSYIAFGEQLGQTRGEYELAMELWPEGFAPVAKSRLDRALRGWDLAFQLWDLKVSDSDNPVEPDVNGYQSFLDYAGDDLVLDTHPNWYIVEDYRRKTFLPFDENIRVLMTIAGDAFDRGKTAVLTELE